jgi:hypothetical protein
MNFGLALLLAALWTVPAPAQEQQAPPEPERQSFRIGGEIKAGLRWSKNEHSMVFFPFPPNFLPANQSQVFMRTPEPGGSLEIQYLALVGEGEITSGVLARFEVRALDLYNRNPTSSDDRIFVRQAYVRFGDKPEPLDAAPGGHFYAQFGMAPRFTKQMVRHLESYGMWGTAVGRFEQPQLELGARLGGKAYLRGTLGSGNPLFFRDTNALAGDNGTPERQPGHVDPIYQSGFPILYDAKASGVVGMSGRFEWGAGIGARLGDADKAAADVLAWYFTRRLSERVRLAGTSYSGDLTLLRGNGVPLPFSGDRKKEWGVNVQARAKGVRLFGQYVDQDIARLRRRGVEVEAAWNVRLNGLFLVGESPFGNWIQPVFRFSWIDNLFEVPREYPGLSVGWDWKKYDFGLRFGLVRGVDLTAEYTLHWVDRGPVPSLPMDELLVTLRVGF